MTKMNKVTSNNDFFGSIASYCNMTSANCTAQQMLSLVGSGPNNTSSSSSFFDISSNESFNYPFTSSTSTLMNLTVFYGANPFERISLGAYIGGTIICSVAALLSLSNFLVIWVILATPFLRSKAVNMLIVNLCFIDLVAAYFDLPLIWVILYHRWNGWVVHPLICKSQLFIHTMSISGQILSFVSVGYERYHTVSKPFDKEKVRRITHLLVVASWLLSLVMATLEIQLAPDTVGYAFCRGGVVDAVSTTGEHLLAHRGILYIMLPFGVTCFLLVAFFYGRILWLVRQHCQNISTTCLKAPIALSGTNNGGGVGHIRSDLSNVSEMPSTTANTFGEICVLDSRNKSLGKRRIEGHIAKRSFWVIISFLAFTLPYPLLVAIEKVFNIEPHYQLQYCLNIMSLFSAGLNPVVYGLANGQFRSQAKKIYFRYLRRYKSREFL